MNFKVISFHWFGNDKMTKQLDFLKFSFDETPSTLLQVLNSSLHSFHKFEKLAIQTAKV